MSVDAKRWVKMRTRISVGKERRREEMSFVGLGASPVSRKMGLA
jgi:hypothetical protein